MSRRFVTLLFLLAAAIPAPAQVRANFAWWNSPIRADLNLSSEQSERIREIVRSYRNRLLDARNNVQKAEGDLEDLLNDQKVDVNTAKPVIDRLASARANSSRVFTEMSVQLRGVLTLEQWRILVRKWGEGQRNRTSLDTQVAP